MKTETASASETVGDFIPDYSVLRPRRQQSLRYVKMKAVGDSEPLGNTYQNTWRHISKDGNIQYDFVFNFCNYIIGCFPTHVMKSVQLIVIKMYTNQYIDL
jgi:hypothetical protein